MKKLMILTITLIFASSAFADLPPSGYLLNEYFGVDDLSVGSDGLFNMNWDPMVGHNVVEDWPTNAGAPDPGPRYFISEAFDLEAMYMDVNAAEEMVYFSIVTSMPKTGFTHAPWYGSYLFRAGDIRFGVGDDQYVLGTMDRSYGGNNHYGNLYHNPDMDYYDGYRGFGYRGDPLLDTLTTVGSGVATSSSFDFTYREYLDANGNSIYENGYATYVMEGTISFADFGGTDLLRSGLSMDLAMSCNNDQLGLNIDPVPEPTTIALLGLGLIGLYTGRRRFIK
ncbi:MAG: PEP-CTERM sorting domain-containing protein [candidate division Zixibacteria bacterium]|nr:PEP-CTERM sorting domain-containing protein [candidate division Zixibacteria bacterium]